MSIFTTTDLDRLRDQDRENIANLAADAFGKIPEELTKEDILVLLDLELDSFPSEIVVDVGETIPAKVQYGSWRGGLSAKVSFGSLPGLAERIVSKEENPVEGLIKASNMIRNFIVSKCARTEYLLRMQLNRTAKEDGYTPMPGTRAAREA